MAGRSRFSSARGNIAEPRQGAQPQERLGKVHMHALVLPAMIARQLGFYPASPVPFHRSYEQIVLDSQVSSP